MSSGIKIFRISALAAVIALLIWSTMVIYQFVSSPLLRNQSSMTIEVPAGTGMDHLLGQLNKKQLLTHPLLFKLIVHFRGDKYRLKAGEYLVEQDTSLLDLLNNMTNGKVMMRNITFIEGWTFREIKAALQQNPYIQHELAGLTDQQLLKPLGSDYNYPEGLFFPDTYSYTRGDSDLSILKQAYVKMQNVLNQAWSNRDVTVPYKDAYQALIVASIVEKETALASERPLVAGVIVNRLRKRMQLQVDPTVVFGLGRPYGSRLTRDDLQLPTIYNTYERRGLPPTPIDVPSRTAIVAALHPQPSDFLYYVSRGDGSHQFSKTYAEHRQAIQQYIFNK